MKRTGILIFCLCLTGRWLHAAPVVESWTDDDRKLVKAGTLVPGASLLVDDSSPDELRPTQEMPPTTEELAVKSEAPEVLPERYFDAYFRDKPKEYLIDPQGLLDEKTRRSEMQFLMNHAKDTKIDIYVYVYGGQQQIPGEVREEEIIERLFNSGKPVVVVNYYLGAPQRAEMHVSSLISDSMPAAEQQRALKNSVDSAFQRINESEQLEEFCLQLSIRAYWMERTLGLTQEGAAPLQAKVKPLEKDDEKKSARKAMILRLAQQLALPVGGGVGGCLLVALIAAVLRARRVYRFPEFEIAPRMGGPYAAGIGPTVSFRKGSNSPSTQRQEVPDYLNRI